MSDIRAELAEQLKSGDTDALGRYLDEIRPQLMAFIERQLGTALRRKVEAEDIFQEAGTAAVKQLADVSLGDRDPFSWLCQIAEHKVIDAHRHFFGAQKRDAGREVAFRPPSNDTEQGDFINMLVNSITTPSQAFSRNVREARLAEAVSQLPDLQREALRLRYVESLPTKEIATQIGKSDAAVRVMLTRSVQKLQELLGNN